MINPLGDITENNGTAKKETTESLQVRVATAECWTANADSRTINSSLKLPRFKRRGPDC